MKTNAVSCFFPFISQLAYCVVQFLEKDSTLTEPVRFIYFDIDFLAFFYFFIIDWPSSSFQTYVIQTPQDSILCLFYGG